MNVDIDWFEEAGAAIASSGMDNLSAWSAFGSAIATGIAAAAAVGAAFVAIRTLRASQRDSRDRSRPMVGAMLVLDQHPGSTYAYLVVRNFGQSVAYHVDVRFDPEICATGTRSKKRSLVPALLRRYENPIPNLMPGVELRNLWFASSGDADDQKAVINDEPIPDVVTATIRYADGPNFWSKDNNRYTDTFVLDVRTLRGDVVVTHSNDQLGLLKRMTSALEMMSTKQTGWGTNISQFLSGATDDRSNWGEENRP